MKDTKQIQMAALYLAKHDEMVKKDPLNTERLAYCLWKGEFYDDLKIVI